MVRFSFFLTRRIMTPCLHKPLRPRSSSRSQITWCFQARGQRQLGSKWMMTCLGCSQLKGLTCLEDASLIHESRKSFSRLRIWNLNLQAPQSFCISRGTVSATSTVGRWCTPHPSLQGKLLSSPPSSEYIYSIRTPLSASPGGILRRARFGNYGSIVQQWNAKEWGFSPSLPFRLREGQKWRVEV